MTDVEGFENGRIAGLQVVSSIGSGGFGSVWLAHDPKIDRLVAVKVLHGDKAADPELRIRFVQEARFLDRAGIDLVVGVHNLDELPDGRPYIVMEYAQGGSLEDRLSKRLAPGGASTDELASLISGLGRCLDALHRAGLIHRDIKPANVLIRRRGSDGPPEGRLLGDGEQLVLADFGVARNMGPDAESAASIVVHSYGWSAPEQMLSAQAPTERADLFAASMIVLWAATGEAATWTGQSPVPVEIPAALDARGHHFRTELLRGLAFAPEDRHESATAWADALTTALADDAAGLGKTAIVPPPVSDGWAPPTPRSADVPSGGALPAPPRSADVPSAEPAVVHGAPGGRSAPAGVAPSATRRRLLLALGGAAVLTVAGGSLVAAQRLSGPSIEIVGPSAVSVGDEVALAAPDGRELDWTVAGQTIRSATATITPTEPGVLMVEVGDGDATRSWEMTVAAAPTRPIEGPGLVVAGESATYTIPSAPADATVIWSDGRGQIEAPTMTLRPTTSGLVVLEATVTAAGSLDTVTVRSITVAP